MTYNYWSCPFFIICTKLFDLNFDAAVLLCHCRGKHSHAFYQANIIHHNLFVKCSPCSFLVWCLIVFMIHHNLFVKYSPSSFLILMFNSVHDPNFSNILQSCYRLKWSLKLAVCRMFSMFFSDLMFTSVYDPNFWNLLHCYYGLKLMIKWSLMYARFTFLFLSCISIIQKILTCFCFFLNKTLMQQLLFNREKCIGTKW